mmetsp:Transcript_47477/g.101367  ORF Transcript_47477/g.101367 Transcript_47477/m.101367 type:complete len:206 (+) Transcript_47477:476-1093(+)
MVNSITLNTPHLSISSVVRTHASICALAASLSSSRPMHTSSVRRSPYAASQSASQLSGISCSLSGQCCRGTAAIHGGPGERVNSVPARAAKTRWLGTSPCHMVPLSRKRLASAPGRGRTSRAARRRTGWKGRRARKTKEEMPYSSVSGVCSCSRASVSQFGCFSASCGLKRAVPSSCCGSSTLCSVHMIWAVWFSLRRNVVIEPS